MILARTLNHTEDQSVDPLAHHTMTDRLTRSELMKRCLAAKKKGLIPPDTQCNGTKSALISLLAVVEANKRTLAQYEEAKLSAELRSALDVTVGDKVVGKGTSKVIHREPARLDVPEVTYYERTPSKLTDQDKARSDYDAYTALLAYTPNLVMTPKTDYQALLDDLPSILAVIRQVVLSMPNGAHIVDNTPPHAWPSPPTADKRAQWWMAHDALYGDILDKQALGEHHVRRLGIWYGKPGVQVLTFCMRYIPWEENAPAYSMAVAESILSQLAMGVRPGSVLLWARPDGVDEGRDDMSDDGEDGDVDVIRLLEEAYRYTLHVRAFVAMEVLRPYLPTLEWDDGHEGARQTLEMLVDSLLDDDQASVSAISVRMGATAWDKQYIPLDNRITATLASIHTYCHDDAAVVAYTRVIAAIMAIRDKHAIHEPRRDVLNAWCRTICTILDKGLATPASMEYCTNILRSVYWLFTHLLSGGEVERLDVDTLDVIEACLKAREEPMTSPLVISQVAAIRRLLGLDVGKV